MCERCDAYGDSLPITDAPMLDAVLDLVRSGQRLGDLEWLDGDTLAAFAARSDRGAAPGLDGARRTGRWLCSACSRMFLLELGSRQPTGDGWRPLYGN
jgi:hypothetical protein